MCYNLNITVLPNTCIPVFGTQVFSTNHIVTDDLGLLDDPERPSFFADAEYGPCSMLNIFLALSMLLLFAGLAFFWDDCSEEDDEERQAMALFAFLVLSWFVDERVDGSPLFRDAKESVSERRRKIINNNT